MKRTIVIYLWDMEHPAETPPAFPMTATRPEAPEVNMPIDPKDWDGEWLEMPPIIWNESAGRPFTG